MPKARLRPVSVSASFAGLILACPGSSGCFSGGSGRRRMKRRRTVLPQFSVCRLNAFFPRPLQSAAFSQRPARDPYRISLSYYYIWPSNGAPFIIYGLAMRPYALCASRISCGLRPRAPEAGLRLPAAHAEKVPWVSLPLGASGLHLPVIQGVAVAYEDALVYAPAVNNWLRNLAGGVP